MEPKCKIGSRSTTIPRSRSRANVTCFKMSNEMKKTSQSMIRIKPKYKDLSVLELPHYKINEVMLLNE